MNGLACMDSMLAYGHRGLPTASDAATSLLTLLTYGQSAGLWPVRLILRVS